MQAMKVNIDVPTTRDLMADNAKTPRPHNPRGPVATVHWLSPVSQDAALAHAVLEGEPGAVAKLYDRHGARIRRLLLRLLGPDDDIAELTHEVFVSAFESIATLKNPAALSGWLTRIAVFHARALIRKRARRRWLLPLTGAHSDQIAGPAANAEVSEALRCTYEVLQKLPANQRTAFTLRFVEGMQLAEVASACGVSLATCKRHLDRAEKHFLKLARQHPVLAPWVEEGRWSEQ